ncbi:hypothetical protein RRG08_055374 [Elysia crispata]|uniref:Uncharacterized protein n=1 Tax=Elysia crispata TaxID=231223 RepID=A0AAE1AQD4_9GAST|nr:hypothetical protein RRG08_055374 [Elysia crispata]
MIRVLVFFPVREIEDLMLDSRMKTSSTPAFWPSRKIRLGNERAMFQSESSNRGWRKNAERLTGISYRVETNMKIRQTRQNDKMQRNSSQGKATNH